MASKPFELNPFMLNAQGNNWHFLGDQLPPGPAILSGSVTPDWEIVQPLSVILEQDEDGSYIVSEDQFGVYGDGSTPVEALRDFILSLADYYFLLATHADNNPAARSLFEQFKTYFRPTSQEMTNAF